MRCGGVRRAFRAPMRLSHLSQVVAAAMLAALAAGCSSQQAARLASLNATATPNATVRLHTDNGMERLVVMRTNQMFDDAGQVTGVVATIKDVTEEAAPQKREVIAAVIRGEKGPWQFGGTQWKNFK